MRCEKRKAQSLEFIRFRSSFSVGQGGIGARDVRWVAPSLNSAWSHVYLPQDCIQTISQASNIESSRARRRPALLRSISSRLCLAAVNIISKLQKATHPNTLRHWRSRSTPCFMKLLRQVCQQASTHNSTHNGSLQQRRIQVQFEAKRLPSGSLNGRTYDGKEARSTK